MTALGIETGADLARHELAFLRLHFGSQADYLYRAARGIDLRRVRADRPRKSVGGERTFERDIGSGAALREALERIIAIVWERIERSGARGRTVTLKLKDTDFHTITRAKSLAAPVADEQTFAKAARALLDSVLPLPQPVRLMGLTLSALEGEGTAPVAAGTDEAGQGSLPF
jgi:DNA polymerase-4